MPDIYWALNEQGRLYIPNKTPEAVTYDEEHRNTGSFYINDSGRITADAIPEPVDWQTPYPNGIWYIDNHKLCNSALPSKLSYTEPYPFSMWYLNTEVGHLHDSAIPFPIIVDAFRNCTNLKNIKVSTSVKSIGKLSFENTAVTSVKLANDCTYYSTTFPQDCVVEGGQIIN